MKTERKRKMNSICERLSQLYPSYKPHNVVWEMLVTEVYKNVKDVAFDKSNKQPFWNACDLVASRVVMRERKFIACSIASTWFGSRAVWTYDQFVGWGKRLDSKETYDKLVAWVPHTYRTAFKDDELHFTNVRFEAMIHLMVQLQAIPGLVYEVKSDTPILGSIRVRFRTRDSEAPWLRNLFVNHTCWSYNTFATVEKKRINPEDILNLL